jgi:iron-sulfur cluster assembly accessory protein
MASTNYKRFKCSLFIFVQIFFCMEMITTVPVSLSTGAVKELKRLMGEPGFDTSKKLRIGVKGGGCSGLSYVLGFDDVQDGDIDFEIEGIPCIMNKNHELYLYGMQIEWQEGLNSRGFTFRNPNASNTCGCGSSFAV